MELVKLNNYRYICVVHDFRFQHLKSTHQTHFNKNNFGY